MPFTFSHPALIVPFLYARKRYQWISATGLIIGSMAPDAEKFFRLKLASQHSHTVASIFYFSCPVSLGLAFLFHWLVRRPLIAHVPAVLHQRLNKYANFNWLSYCRRHPWGVLFSILLGSALHLFWDSFTHDNTVLTSAVPYADDLVWVGNKTMPLWQLVALGSSVAGGLINGLAIWKMPVYQASPVPGFGYIPLLGNSYFGCHSFGYRVGTRSAPTPTEHWHLCYLRYDGRCISSIYLCQPMESEGITCVGYGVE
jgi:hypothetical protein